MNYLTSTKASFASSFFDPSLSVVDLLGRLNNKASQASVERLSEAVQFRLFLMSFFEEWICFRIDFLGNKKAASTV